MRAFVVPAPYESLVTELDPPVPAPGQVVVDVERVGVCGTDVEFYTGEMEYIRQGHAVFPLRLGHEWSGTISAVGDGVDPGLVGRRTTGDTMIGCASCRRCREGLPQLCPQRVEIGVRGGWPGALAEQLPVPHRSLHLLPDTVDAVAGAMVEPGGNALRAARATAAGAGSRLLVIGPGTIGLLAGLFAQAAGAEVHLLGLPGPALDFARTLGLDGVWAETELPELRWDAVLDASNGQEMPARSVELVDPGGRVVLIGLAPTPSLLDTRAIALKDLTVVGILGASGGLQGAIEHYASGAVDPRPLVAATVTLDEVGAVLSGSWPRPEGGPKILVDPRAR
jgi:threonine dehydrogenase-like Zn-dependent dehydrogenase